MSSSSMTAWSTTKSLTSSSKHQPLNHAPDPHCIFIFFFLYPEPLILILTDYCMPAGMNGHDLLLAIKVYVSQMVLKELLQKPLKVKDLDKLRSYAKAAVPVPNS
ncbi:hypothetical protein M0R45_007241 [Rubus argutus]|uniref:Uncharacterized protein n=1 Tax=Rubus argutus TaxID=59490 RepID=A0AAW1Y131_RUBAR